MTRVPRILHQTWKTEDVPAQWLRSADSWKSMHPGWQFRLWTDEANRAFVAEHYPELLATYDGYAFAIQRADVVRYCLLHHFGGVYADLDIECLRPVDELLEGGDFIAVWEPQDHANELGAECLVSNAFMASTPNHPFLSEVIEWLIAHSHAGVTHRDVLETTGPLMLTEVLQHYRGELTAGTGTLCVDGVTVLPSHVAFPVATSTPEIERLRGDDGNAAALRSDLVRGGAYAVHYWANSWVGALAGELINPRPHSIHGFNFYPGMDSPGDDIANVGRNIHEAAEACRRIEGAVAFNTDGMVKGRLLPRASWRPMGDGALNEGLYVLRKPGLPAVLERAFRKAKPGRLFRALHEQP
jgi:hypothetical protein